MYIELDTVKREIGSVNWKAAGWNQVLIKSSTLAAVAIVLMAFVVLKRWKKQT